MRSWCSEFLPLATHFKPFTLYRLAYIRLLEKLAYLCKVNKCENKMGNEQLVITIKTLFGVEQTLQEELKELGYNEVTVLNRAVQLKGSWKDVYFLNLHLRCAISVLVELAKFRIRDEKDLYKQAMKIDWTSYFDVDKTFAVKGAVFSSLFSHTQFPYLLVKDAIVDTFRDKMGERPDVNIKTPQLMFDLYIKDQDVTLSFNTSGVPLYQRGYRSETGFAPINEVLAAAMIRMSGWDRKSTFIDPFCGSGTLLIEAALLATGIPSCIERQHFAFKNMKNFDAEYWQQLQDEVSSKIKNWSTESLGFELLGSDIDAEMIFKAKRNLRGLPIARVVELSVNSFEENNYEGKAPGVLICNPPYGERLHGDKGQDDIEEMYENMGSWFKKELSGFTCWVISSNEDALKAVGLKPSKKIKLFNGDLDCSFRAYQMFQGSHKEQFVTSEVNG